MDKLMLRCRRGDPLVSRRCFSCIKLCIIEVKRTANGKRLGKVYRIVAVSSHIYWISLSSYNGCDILSAAKIILDRRMGILIYAPHKQLFCVTGGGRFILIQIIIVSCIRIELYCKGGLIFVGIAGIGIIAAHFQSF